MKGPLNLYIGHVESMVKVSKRKMLLSDTIYRKEGKKKVIYFIKPKNT